MGCFMAGLGLPSKTREMNEKFGKQEGFDKKSTPGVYTLTDARSNREGNPLQYGKSRLHKGQLTLQPNSFLPNIGLSLDRRASELQSKLYSL